MRLFKPDYYNVFPYQGCKAQMVLADGKRLKGEIIEVRHDGILFNSDNPGLFFYPFAAIAALTLLAIPFAYGAGYGAGTAYGRYPYGRYPYY